MQGRSLQLFARALLVGSVLLAKPASAADSPSEKADAVALSKEALSRARSADYEGARGLYAKAYELTHASSVLFNLALAELRSTHALDALTHFRQYVSDAQAEPAKVEIVNGELLPKAYAATGHISLAEAPKGAFLFLDDQPLAEPRALLVDVMPGRHLLTARTLDAGWSAKTDAPAGILVTAKFQIVFAGAARPWPPRRAIADAGADLVSSEVRR